MMAYNDEPGRTHDQKWFLTANLLKKFTPKGNQRAAERVLADRAQGVQQHHAKHQLLSDHNYRHKNHNPLDILSLDP